MTQPIPTEEIEQSDLVRYLEAQHCKFTAIPNSTFTRSWNQKTKNKLMGLRAGFPDMVIIANNKFFCIEMKRSDGGQVSKPQKEWHEALRAAGIDVHVCAGVEEAIKVVDSYLDRPESDDDKSRPF